MASMILFVLLGLIKFRVATNCRIGTQVENSTCSTLTGQTCVGGYISPATEFFTCGNCTQYLELANVTGSLITNVSCCSSDYCEQVTIAPSSSSCDSINASDVCINQTNCYWCNNTMNTGYGSCRSWAGIPSCFIVPLFVPPPICGAVICPPVSTPYMVSNPSLMGKAALNAFGLPTPDYLTAMELAADLLFRQYKVFNDTTHNCIAQQDLIQWCGVNYSDVNSFPYCLASETWPQPDIGGWILNTTFSSSRRYHDGLWPLYTSICACNKPGRAFFLPVRKYIAEYHYDGNVCPIENVSLAFWILLMLLSTVLLIYLLWDAAILFYYLWSSGSETSKAGNRSGRKTGVVKFVMIVYFLFTIPCQALEFAPTLARSAQEDAVITLRLLGIIFMLFASCLGIFNFLGIILESGAFGKLELIIKTLKIFQWGFLIFSSVVLLTCVGLLTAVSWYLSALYSYSVPNVTVFGQYGTRFGSIIQSVCLLLTIYEGIMIIVTLILVGYVFTIFRDARKIISKQHFKDIFIRYLGIVFWIIFAIPNLAFLVETTVDAGWIEADKIPNPFANPYDTITARFWFIWSQCVTELLMLACITYATRTKVTRSWIFNNIKTLMGMSTEMTTGVSDVSDITMTSNTVNDNAY